MEFPWHIVSTVLLSLSLFIPLSSLFTMSTRDSKDERPSLAAHTDLGDGIFSSLAPSTTSSQFFYRPDDPCSSPHASAVCLSQPPAESSDPEEYVVEELFRQLDSPLSESSMHPPKRTSGVSVKLRMTPSSLCINVGSTGELQHTSRNALRGACLGAFSPGRTGRLYGWRMLWMF